MTRYHHVALAALGSLLGVMTPLTAIAQSPPDWLVWRAFHDSLEFYENRTPGVMATLLTERLRFTKSQTSTFKSAGHAYLRRMGEIDDDARTEVAARYGNPAMPQRMPASAAKPGDLVRSEYPSMRSVLVPGRTLDGRSVRDAAIADGLAAQVEERRTAALQAHLDSLQRTLGEEVLIKLELWIAVDVTPYVSLSAEPVPQLGTDPPLNGTDLLQAR